MKKNTIASLSLLISICGCTPLLTNSFIISESEKIEDEVIEDVIKEEEKTHQKAVT